MSKEVSSSHFESIKPPNYHHTHKLVEKKMYLDELYTKNWLNNYFSINEKSTHEKSTDEKSTHEKSTHEKSTDEK